MNEMCENFLEQKDNRRLCTLLVITGISVLFLGLEYRQVGKPSDYLAQSSSVTTWTIRATNKTQQPEIVPNNVQLEFVPRLYEKAGQRFDDLRTGKSCRWVGEKESDPHNHNGKWQCRDCGTTGGTCQLLRPKGKCKAFSMINWDAGDGVRQRSHFRTDAFRNPTSWVTGTFDTPTWYESPVCSPDLTLPCFDLNKCSREDGPMKVYIYNPERTPELLKGIQRAERLQPNDIQYTPNHDEACLYVIELNTFAEKKDMLHDPLYMAGQNHFIWHANVLFESHGDRVKPHSFNMEFAATLSGSLTDAQVRPGYDMVATMPQPWRRPGRFDDLELHRQRRLLLSFKGRIERWKMPFQHHRWIASEYWNDPDVVVDAACGGGAEYKLPGEEAYSELLLNSTFVFCPGGGGVSSYRFNEALAADAIPVTMPHQPLPFEPDVDWEGCVVRISEARLIDAPRILRNIPEDEVHSRRERCRQLYRGVIGRVREPSGDWTCEDHHGAPLQTALRIWRQRTLHAHRKRDVLKGIEEVIQDRAANEEKYKNAR